MPTTTTLPSQRTAELLRIALDAAPLIAAATAQLPTHRGTMVGFAVNFEGVQAMLVPELTAREWGAALTIIGREFEGAGWGSNYGGASSVHLIHPLHLTRHGGPESGPTTLTAVLAADGGADPVGRALSAAGHLRQAAAWRAAAHPAPSGRQADPVHPDREGEHPMSVTPIVSDPATECANCGHPSWTLHFTVSTRSPAPGSVAVAMRTAAPGQPLDVAVTCATCGGWLDEQDLVHAALRAFLANRCAPAPARSSWFLSLLRRTRPGAGPA
ncbi:hypothetical protein ACFRKE_36435 [Kitasatospora indigofera]|uniref:hypothetical protein n=1 Tax=Kitasatospora indigofera TaxID=67307 RepID=UPI0036C037EA